MEVSSDWVGSPLAALLQPASTIAAVTPVNIRMRVPRNIFEVRLGFANMAFFQS
jgi:hypothetical protein